jgi:2-hydroxy-3-keto-5-methylthiopentenyl-1-phosphate phosphatase
MAHHLLSFLNLDPDEDIQESLRLALMFKEEVDEATQAYMEMLQITIDNSGHTHEEITEMIQEAINAALLTGIRAYRGWIESQGIDVQAVEVNSGKDIPLDFFHTSARWPL